MNVYATWKILYLGLEANNTETSNDGVELLKIFSFFYWENICVDILIAAAKNPSREQEVTEKAEDSLKTTVASKGNVRL